MAIKSNMYSDKVEITYEGCVLWWYERNGYNDSDWYAIVWDDEEKKVKTVEYDTTRCGCHGDAEVDITEENLRKVIRYYKAEALKEIPIYIKNYKNIIEKGREVEVIRGRKVKKGTIGKVFWTGERYNQFSRLHEKVVGIELKDGSRVFVLMDYVTTTNKNQYNISGKEIKKMIINIALSNLPCIHRNHFKK